MAIIYSIITGSLPPGLSMNLTGRIVGTPPSTVPPTWNTASDAFPQGVAGEPVLFTLSATSAYRATPIRFQTVSTGILPPGLVLNTATGVITGTPIIDDQMRDFADVDAPIWNTEPELEAVDERSSFTLTLSATPIRGSVISYVLLDDYGHLPSGLWLDSASGEIAGTTPEQNGPMDNDPTKVVWETPAGVLGVASEFTPFSVTVSATADTPVFYSVRSNAALPGGIMLNGETGEISGTLAEIVDETEAFVPPSNAPIWSTSADLGAVAGGGAANIPLVATPSAGRTMRAYYLVGGTELPAGLLLNSTTGMISGTFPTVAQPTDVQISVFAEDGAFARARRDFFLTIN